MTEVLTRGELDFERNNMKEGRLFKAELFWRDHQPWLKECGYLLRPRYDPDWVASWKGGSGNWGEAEDALVGNIRVLDATRIADGSFVKLKQIEPSQYADEVDIGRMFSSEPIASDSRNHCIPIYEVLRVPDDDDLVLLVMPMLHAYDTIPFVTIGEAVEFIRQIFEGLQFMHSHQIAHRDCKYNNIMMDAKDLYLHPPHPVAHNMRRDFSGPVKHTTRTRRPVKYYLIDFGLSRRYNPEDMPPLEPPPWGGDRTVPEFLKSDEPCNPFPVDVYFLGNVVRQNFIEGDVLVPAKRGFEFIEDLVADMVQDDPQKRPTMDEVVSRFDQIRNGLSSWKLRSRVVERDESRFLGFFRSIAHWTRGMGLIVRRIPSVPTVP